MARGFRHRDGAQEIVFGRGALAQAAALIAAPFTLLTTARAAALAPALASDAAAVVHVPGGRVEDAAAAVLARVDGPRIVALGGGRVIDVAKAVCAARRLPGPVAIPTTLSGAEMTRFHRHARGVPDTTPRVRAAVVVNDPALSASQPEPALAASSANALGHAATALASARSTPIARAVAADAVARMARAWATDAPDRDGLALAALLAGWAVDRSGLGPHHALSQTAVRVAGVGHAQANAALLPFTVRALRRRAPDALVRLEGELPVPPAALADALRDRAGVDGLGPLAGDPALLERAVAVAVGRAELDRVPPPLTADEVRAIYRGAAGVGAAG